MDVPGYELSVTLFATSRGVLVRARRRSDGRAVLVKGPFGAEPSQRSERERESETLRRLRPASAPHVLDIVQTRDGPLLFFEDGGLAPVAAKPGVRVALRCAAGIAAALGELHERDLSLGTLHPGSVLASADGSVVQVVDWTGVWGTGVGTRSAPVSVVSGFTSPEQTGRINRDVDYRSDFYALGAVLYQWLTGGPPFASDDPLELIHAHVARLPQSVSVLEPTVPDLVSALVSKLLAKSPDERYQSARGLLYDLRECERSLDDTELAATFVLGQRDVSDRFRIPQRLYGRQTEQQLLLEAFRRVAGGRTSLVLVTGYAGAGKTALIGELARPIALQRGRFSIGKFDQVVRNIPYGALVQAFRGLVWQLLSESEIGLATFRQRLTSVLGPNVAVLAEIIPEIELIAGPQPAPRAVDPAESQNRFRYVIQSFVGSLAGADHPLVLVLDDLQWADPATLHLVHALLTTPELTHLLIIGAYRDNEVDADHPLTTALARLRAAGADVTDLPLAPLDRDELGLLLQDTLHGEVRDIEPLARLIQEKTDGNPFFVTQFLQTLQHDGLFRFDAEVGRWTFDVDSIARTGTTDNVIDLMTRRIRGLTPAAQQAVTLAACIGSQFDLDTFLAVSRQSPETATDGLAEAIAAGLVVVVSGSKDSPVAAGTTYSFLHDRVQQAAYELIPGEKRVPLHLDIGRLLLARYPEAVPEERLFEVVNHLSVGRALIERPAERLALARLSLAAARKAKASAAYQTAAHYAAAGLELLPPDSWTHEYQLTFDLHFEAAECQYLTGAFDSAEAVFESVLDHATSNLDRANVYAPRMVLYENLSRWPEAIASGRDGLALLGVHFPDVSEERLALLEREVEEAERERGSRPIGSLIDLPVMGNEEIRMAMRILRSLWASAYISGDHVFARLISVRMVRLSLKYGTCEDSAYGYVTHAITIGPVRHDYQAAFEWGALALAVNEHMADPRLRAKVHQQFQAHVNLWRRPFATCIPHAREARRSGLEGGDFTYAAYGAVTESWSAFLITQDLAQFVRDFTPTLALLDAIRMSDFSVVLQVMLNWARALQGQTTSPTSLSDDAFDEEALIARYTRAAPFFLTFFQTARLHLALVFDAPARALAAAEEAWRVVQIGTVWPALVDGWGGLAISRAWDLVPAGDRDAYRRRFDAARASLDELADNAPENFRCFALMLAAEAARLDGRVADAAASFDAAIDYARRTGAMLHEAMANDLAGHMWLARQRQTLAAAYLADARRCYSALHADAKVAQLDARHGALLASLQQEPARGTTAVMPSGTDDVASLDMATVLKVADAVAAEMDVHALLEKLMRFALENAGAQRGIFLQERNGALVVEAEAVVDQPAVAIGGDVPFEVSAGVAHTVVRYVRRTAHAVVIDDAARDERVAGDPYITRTSAKSILCVPVEHQGRLRGILYLENNLTTGGFTQARIVMMRALAAQTAISLENARLYEEMKSEVALRRSAETALRSAMTELEGLKNRLEAENVYLQEEIRTQHNFDEIVGNSPALIDVLRQVERVAPIDTTVLIVGETGSGKELFARAVHSRSTRKMRPLVKVNCGAIAPGLVESELFGHVKGAFTGAVEKRVGRFEVADGGTIFLDEVGELPLDAQVKLLRVLQEQEFEPVGSSRTIRVSVRVIAATNRNLEQAVREGRFRADLLYRLNVFPIEVPPLRARQTDIPLLAGFFVSRVARRVGKTLDGFNARSMDRMMEYSWPGNVRELQNLVERSAILAEGTILSLEGTFLSGPPSKVSIAAPSSVVVSTLDDAQRQHIITALKNSGGVVEGPKGAATQLGVHPNTLRSRMKKLGISGARS